MILHKEAKVAKEPQINIDIIMLSLPKHFPSFQLGERKEPDGSDRCHSGLRSLVLIFVHRSGFAAQPNPWLN